MRPLTRRFTLFILFFFFSSSLALAELLTHPVTNVPTEGWDGPGQGSATINWFLGWRSDNNCASQMTGLTTDNGLSTAQVETEVTQAMATWASIVDVRFNKVGDSQAPGSGCFNAPTAESFDCDGNPDTFQINIYWANNEHCHPPELSAWWFDGPWDPSDQSANSGYVFAHAWGPYDILGGWNPLFGGNIHLDDGELWVNNNASNIVDEFDTSETNARVDIQTEVLHELGHSLGLGHTNSSNAVMNPYKWNLQRRNLTQHDRNSLLSIYRPAQTHPGIVMLFDLSGSMNWAFDGSSNAAEADKRLTLAKNAALPFLALINTYGEDYVEFAIADFRSDGRQCVGHTKSGMSLASDAAIEQASTLTVPSLTASGNTPLLAGLQHAQSLFSDHDRKAIVLLSDGYHNCPESIHAGDQSVTDLVNQLSANNTLVYPIGFGRPEDFDSALLSRLASDTGGQFHPVTGPNFDASNWNPTTALQNTYKNILVDALGLDVLVDPLAVIDAGQTHEYEIQLTEHDNDVSFMLSWATNNAKRMSLELVSSDNQSLPSSAVDIERRSGDNFIVVTVKKTYLQAPGRLSNSPWIFRISASGLKAGEQEHYQYSVLSRSGVQLRSRVNAASKSSGQPLLLTAALVENGQPIIRHGDVEVQVIAPQQSMGNWLSKNDISQTELKTAADRHLDKSLSPVALKTIALAQLKNIALPTAIQANRLKLYDDGTHGDKRGADGVYSAEFDQTDVSGTYEFVFTAKAKTQSGREFTRESREKLALNFELSPSDTLVSTTLESGKTLFTVTPRDSRGSYLGPGYGGSIKLALEGGETIGELKDNLDGTYSQSLQLETGHEKTPRVELIISGVKMEITISETTDLESNDKSWSRWLFVFLLLLILLLLRIFLRRFR